MAGDWIKMRVDLKDDPAVFRLADILGVDEFSVVGRLHCFWAWADKHAVDGRVDGATSRLVDRVSATDGFCAALQAVGWLEVDAEGISIPKFDRHNGESAKERGLKNQRQAKWRAKQAPAVDAGVDAGVAACVDGCASTKPSTREEKRREDTNTARKRAAPAVLVSVDDMVSEGVDRQVAADWLVNRKTKGLAPLTPSIWSATKEEAQKAGVSIADAIKAAATEGWGGFKAKWLENLPDRPQAGAEAGYV